MQASGPIGHAFVDQRRRPGRQMTEAGEVQLDELSLFGLVVILLRQRWRIVRWGIIGLVIAVAPVLFRPALFKATTSFTPQGADAPRSGLASIAGQLGVSIPASSPSQSPDFYLRLLKSREILAPITRDTFSVPELGGRRVAFLDLFKINAGSEQHREELGVIALTGMIAVSIDKNAGIVDVGVLTPWPAVSLGIASAIIEAVNSFNQHTRQVQAGAERKFVESRLAIAQAELRAAEDRLQRFLATNRQYDRSPELTFDQDRLQRDVTTQQQVATSLTQSYEEVRIREVRDTPIITVIESPAVPTLPESRGRAKRGLLGLLLGGFLASLVILVSETMARQRASGDSSAAELVETLADIRTELMHPFHRLRGARDKVAH